VANCPAANTEETAILDAVNVSSIASAGSASSTDLPIVTTNQSNSNTTGTRSFYIRPDFVIIGSITNSFATSRWFHQSTNDSIHNSAPMIMNTFDPVRHPIAFDTTSPTSFIASVVDKHALRMSADAQRILFAQNAGGSSELSEALSFELMRVLFNARLIHTEMELNYWPLGSKITDYSMEVDDQVFGVSVTRAMKYKGLFELQDGVRLLNKKLFGVNASSKAVVPTQRWSKQILHIWAQSRYIFDVLVDAYENFMDDELRSNTLVMVTVAENAPWIFK